ncbi:MAG: alanine--tRNA ligase [Bacteroidales bacterium]|nr:MAG: alanine--tRNA ligase [Bacteroidales bacterium]
MTSKEIRQSFLDFFASKNHKIVPSAPMVIKDDPTLMFTNAGMNQFKNIILGNDPIKYPRVADSQKCLRVSGKHNDLEEVGLDTYHHTMFEMLGNWSFGDYFKKEAIEWAWEYLTEVLKLDKNRLYVTVFEGSPNDNITRDDEASYIWEQLIDKDRIINGNKKDNFWEMGDTGPCGPCSEIHIDIRPDEQRKKIDGKTLVNKDHPQVIEIWNNVFMQYNRKVDGTLEDLPAKVIDTGMGFERLCMAMQGKTSNYDTDIFQPIIQTIANHSGIAYGKSEKSDIAMRVIADHLRTIAFSITDGQLPSNAKAGYVIRRILRRAVRYGYTFLNQQNAFIYRLLDVLCDVMGEAYPELLSQKELIGKVIREEEESFLRTLDTGIKLLDKQITSSRQEGKSVISGVDAFTLYDTFGFPLDLTELILRENGMSVNTDEFNAEMQKQKDRARNAASVEATDWVHLNEGESQFVGYDIATTETKILRYRKVTHKKKSFYQIVLSKTPFYAEMGGQVGDKGILIDSKGDKTMIFDTKKENNLSVHLVDKLPVSIDGIFTAKIDEDYRMAITCNHSATHLLHETLRQILGSHIEQKGSYVSAESLRFDFSHYQKLTKEEIRAVEKEVNRKIRSNYPLEEMRDIPIAEAQKMGAMALFGEKYGETVRVIRMGTSTELCGGTHIDATGNIGMMRIVSESSIASGIRRIEAITGRAVEDMIDAQQDMCGSIKELYNNSPDIIKAIERSLNENLELKKQVEVFEQQRIISLRDTLMSNIDNEGGVNVIRSIQKDMSADNVKGLVFNIRNLIAEKGSADQPFMIVIGAVYNDKPSLTLFLSDELVEKGYSAVNLIRTAAKEIQGGGGGQPHFATAGGRNINGLQKAMDMIKL